MADEDKVIKSIAQRLLIGERAARRQFELDPFQFRTDFVNPALAASATATLNFLVQADSAFAIVKTMGVVSDTSNVFISNISDTPKFTPILVTFSDSGSGRDLMDQAIAWDNILGTAQRPYHWPKIKLLDPNSTFNTRLQNLVATAFNVRIAFGGFKVFGNVAAFKAART